MKIGVLGTGNVGETISTKLIELGHEVMMGSRTASNEKAAAWAKKTGERASSGTFADAAKHGEVLFSCTLGTGSVEALTMAGDENLSGKVIIDTSNPLDFSKGRPPTLFLGNTDSLGEALQRTFPQARIVKALNTMWCGVMVNPRLITESHAVFIAGNDRAAKETVKGLLASFGWRNEELYDMGDITAARATEAMLPLWVRLWGLKKTGAFNFKVVTAPLA